MPRASHLTALATAIAVLTVTGCSNGPSHAAAAAPGASSAPPSAALSGPPWQRFTKPCPQLHAAGLDGISTGQQQTKGEQDTTLRFTGACQYGAANANPSVQLTSEIARIPAAWPHERQLHEMNRDSEKHSKDAFLDLPQPADSAFASTYDGGAVLLDAWSRNAHLMLLIRFADPVTTQADLESHRTDLTSVLTDILGDLQPVG
jgi:hypothetical protein